VDEKPFVIEQRFTRGDETVAIAVVAGRFLGPQGSLPPADVVALGGLDPASPPLPDWAARLAAAQQGHAGVSRAAKNEIRRPQ
jgi:hypothetical protein